MWEFMTLSPASQVSLRRLKLHDQLFQIIAGIRAVLRNLCLGRRQLQVQAVLVIENEVQVGTERLAHRMKDIVL